MPKLKAPLIALRADGRLGKELTFAHTKQGTIVKRRPTHIDAHSLTQLVQRQTFNDCRVWWHTLTPAEKEVYRLKDPRLGGPSAYLNFMRECLLGLVPMAVSKIVDADGDTWVDVEKAADEDIIRMAVKSIEAFILSGVGELSLPKQSGCAIYLANAQTIDTGANRKVALDTKVQDVQNEFDVSIIAGVADATEAFKLHDADGGFVPGDVGRTVWNTTDHTYTTVTGFVDSGELDLAHDKMANGEGYKLFFSRFTAKEAGSYITTVYGAIINLGADKDFDTAIYKNGAGIGRLGIVTPIIRGVRSAYSARVNLAINDTLEFWVWHDHGGNRILYTGVGFTGITIQRVA